MNDNQAATQVTQEQIIEVMQAHLRVTIMGLTFPLHNIPSHVILPALCEGFGRVISECTQFGNPSMTLQLRGIAQEAFGRGIKKTPAVVMAAGMPEPAKAN